MASQSDPVASTTPAAPQRSARAIGVFALAALTVVVLAARRPDQFLNPYIWVEDGTMVLKAYAERGLASIVEPVSGYYLLATKLITLSAFKLSIEFAPEIALALTVAFTCAVVIAVAMSPTHLPHRFLCAACVLAVPTGPEIFAVSLYAFWWTGLLLVLALLWRDNREGQWLRFGYVLLGGLSSPLILPLSGLFVLRAVIERRRTEALIAGLALILMALQAHSVIRHGLVQNVPPIDMSTLLTATNKFAGSLFVGPRNAAFYSGPALLLVLAALAYSVRRHLTYPFLLLVLAWGGICAIIVLRLPVELLDPRFGGIRYFFFPYVLLSWITIWLASLSSWTIRAIAAAGYLLGLAWMINWMSARHDPLDWRTHLRACAQSDRYQIPIHYFGDTRTAWSLTLSGAECRDLIARSLIRP